MIRFGQYIAGRSFGHRLDARVKILAAVFLSLLVFHARGWQPLLISIFLVAVCLVCRLKPAPVLQALRPLVLFAGLLFCLHAFFTEGAALFEAPALKVRITEEGLSRGLLVSWQFLALAFCGAVLTMTTSPSDLIQGLEHLLRPLRRLRVPAQDIAIMVSMALRFVPTLLEEFDRIRTAQAARGAEVARGRLTRKIKVLSMLVVPLLASAFRRAEELAEAMEARGYAGGTRTTLNALHFGRNEAATIIVLITFISLTLVT